MIVFTVVRLTPGDPAEVQFGPRANDPRFAEALQALRHKMGLDKPIPMQYFIWLGHMARGDLGTSIRSGRPVLEMILRKLPATLELIAGGLFFGLLFGLPIGLLSGLKYRSFLDRFSSLLSWLGLAVPVFWLGLLLILIFAVHFRWLPASGYVPLTEDPWENIRHLIMPAISLGVYELALFSRFLRAEIIDVMRENYIRTARAKGLGEQGVVLLHALKNALIPLITIIGLEIGYLLGGSVVIEQVFGWSGVGWLALQAINNRDYPLIQGIVLLLALGYSVTNLLVDIAYAYVNPRIRFGTR